MTDTGRVDDLSWMTGAPALETPHIIEDARILRRDARARAIRATQKEELEKILTELPQPGEAWHIVSNGHFDYWQFTPVILSLLARPAEAFYGSTWTLNRGNVLELFELYDTGRIRAVTMLTGMRLGAIKPAVRNTLVAGLLDRGQRYLAFKNHAKVMLLDAPPDYFVIEGSANFTANPRLEQTVLVNDRNVFDFHRTWMEDMLTEAARA